MQGYARDWLNKQAPHRTQALVYRLSLYYVLIRLPLLRRKNIVFLWDASDYSHMRLTYPEETFSSGVLGATTPCSWLKTTALDLAHHGIHHTNNGR